MRAFSQLLDALVYTRSRNTKLQLIGDYLKSTPDPDRGIALAALTGSLSIPAVKGAAIRAIAEERVDPTLLHMSRDYVGDMAETVSLLWPTPGGEPEMDDGTLTITGAVERLANAGRATAPQVLAEMLDHLDASGRFALLKLATGNLRIGISARLAKQALANAFDIDVDRLRMARDAIYGIGSLRSTTEPQRAQYFSGFANDRWQLRRAYREGVEFAFGNILDLESFSRGRTYDVIFCRNVLIYFSEGAFQHAIANFARALRRGGLLFLGHSESLIGRSDRFETVRLERCIAYRKLRD